MTATVVSQRNLTQDEIDGYWRLDFVNQVLDYITDKETRTENTVHVEGGKTAQFLARKNNPQFSLVTIKARSKGEWEFSIADKHLYTYRLSNLIDFIEQLYDECEIASLNSEIQLSVTHLTANAE